MHICTSTVAKAARGTVTRTGYSAAPCLGAVSRVSEFHVLFPGTRRIERFAEASQKRLDAGEVRAAVRNLRAYPELRDAERVQETDELPALKSRARHVRR